MNIALLNVMITIQKNTTVVDEIGNHTNEWDDFYSCHATVSGTSAGGKDGALGNEAGQETDSSDLSFTIRFCQRSSLINVTEYRVLFHDEIYEITGIDYMNFKKKSLKLKCRKVRR